MNTFELPFRALCSEGPFSTSSSSTLSKGHELSLPPTIPTATVDLSNDEVPLSFQEPTKITIGVSKKQLLKQKLVVIDSKRHELTDSLRKQALQSKSNAPATLEDLIRRVSVILYESICSDSTPLIKR